MFILADRVRRSTSLRLRRPGGVCVRASRMDAGVALASESLAPWIELGRARTPEGSELLLRARDDCCEIRCDGRELMSTRSYASEEAMARFACERLFAFGAADAACVLVGGLGLALIPGWAKPWPRSSRAPARTSSSHSTRTRPAPRKSPPGASGGPEGHGAAARCSG